MIIDINQPSISGAAGEEINQAGKKVGLWRK